MDLFDNMIGAEPEDVERYIGILKNENLCDADLAKKLRNKAKTIAARNKREARELSRDLHQHNHDVEQDHDEKREKSASQKFLDKNADLIALISGKRNHESLKVNAEGALAKAFREAEEAEAKKEAKKNAKKSNRRPTKASASAASSSSSTTTKKASPKAKKK